MDFKNYVRLYLNEGKDEEKEDCCPDCGKPMSKCKCDEKEEDCCPDCGKPMSKCKCDEKEEDSCKTDASCKTKNGTTGSEASCCTKKTLKEEIVGLSKYISNAEENIMSEEVQVMLEGIENNSASKYMTKLYKRAEKEAAKWEKKGQKEAAKISRESAKKLKEAANKLYKCEASYKAGDVLAKKEYKSICKQYSKELKNMGKTAKGFKNLLFTVLAGAVLLGGIGLTKVANDDLIDKLETGFREKDKMPEILKSIAVNDKNAIAGIIDKAKEGDYWKTGENTVALDKEKLADNAKEFGKKVKEGLDNAKEHADDKYFDKNGKITDWKTQKADWAAQKEGYKDANEQEKFERFGKNVGEKIAESGRKIKGAARGVEKSFSGTAKGFSKGLKG